MKKLLAIYNTYTGQRGSHDCGIACLSMMLKYTGRYDEGDRLWSTSTPGSSSGLSLLDLRNLATDAGIISRCVQMSPETLQELGTPCVLHTTGKSGDSHFAVCFGACRWLGNWRYLIADPATGIGWRDQKWLKTVWKSGAALYPVGLTFRLPRLKDHTWYALVAAVRNESTLFLSVSVLNMSTAILGISLSWLLQRGLNGSLTTQRTVYLAGAISLLCFMLLARSAGTYLKQRLLIRVNADIRQRYHRLFISYWSGQPAGPSLKKAYAELQKIQNAATALISTMVGDGILVVLLVSAMIYYEPLAGLIIIGFLCCCLISNFFFTGRLLSEQAELNDLMRTDEATTLDMAASGLLVPVHQGSENEVIKAASSLSHRINAQSLYLDCISTGAMISILSLCLYRVRQNCISYDKMVTEVVVCFFIFMVTTRICQAIPVITDGARSVRKYHV